MGSYQPRDHYFKRAKREGYAARSVYKLQEIDRKLKLLARGARVLDLGAAPGSWTQYASEAVGPKGLVAAVDRTPLRIHRAANVRSLEADVFAVLPTELRDLAGGGDYDVVLSDMAPATTGDRFVDQQRSTELGLRALELARALLKVGGAFVAKALEGESTRELVDSVRVEFGTVRLVRPESTRKGSTELFVIGIGRKKATEG